MQLFLKTPPATEPLTLEEVKTYLRLQSDEEDGFLHTLIASARAYVEGETGRALIKQKWLMEIKPPYPSLSPLVKGTGKSLEIDLPCPPLLEVETIKVGKNDVPFTTVESKIKLPLFAWDKELSITYWAGYGETCESIPPSLKMAVLMATRFFYDNQKVDLPMLRPFKVLRIV